MMDGMMRAFIGRLLRRGAVATPSLPRARALIAAARELQRAELAGQAAESPAGRDAYALAHAALDELARVPDAPEDVLRLAAAAGIESGLGDPLSHLERAFALPVADPRARAELGALYLGLGLRERAGACFEAALSAGGDDPAAHAARALLRLGDRDYAGGWDEYEWRHRARIDPTPRGDMPYPDCGGEHRGRHVFVASEQGIGDEIMFASCVPDLLAEAAGCVLECSARLVPLFRRSFPAATVIARNRSEWPGPDVAPGIECGTWAGSLPRRYRREPAAFPGTPYLKADPGAVEAWRRKLASTGAARRIGLAWSGGLPETARAQRSIPLDALAPLFDAGDTAFISLELLDRSAEAREVTARGGASLHHWPGVAADLDGLAALIDALDEVICVPNAAAHLAGALGKPVRVLVAGAPTWRYGWAGERVDWYASMRVLRRPPGLALRDWIGALR